MNRHCTAENAPITQTRPLSSPNEERAGVRSRNKKSFSAFIAPKRDHSFN